METKKIYEKLLMKVGDVSFGNSININKLQKICTEEIMQICEEIFTESFNCNKKSDAINLIVRKAIKTGYYVVGLGVIDIVNGDNYGFIRHSENNYSPSNDDVFINSRKIKKFLLRSGDEIGYIVKSVSDEDKRMSITDIISINGLTIENDQPIKRKVFEELSPQYPSEKFKIGDSSIRSKNLDNIIPRMVDIFAPIGFGQRGLIVAPPKSGKTTIFQNLAEAITTKHPEVKVIILLIDERPEEVTDMKMKIGTKCKIMYSDFNENSNKHIHIAEICIEHAKRLAEMGEDVVIFLDSLTRLARAFNVNAQNTGRVLSGGVDASALQKSKKLFGIARNISCKGSLTIIATCLVETGSKMDEVIFEEFKGTGNMEIVLNRQLAEKGVYPAIDILKSGTRRSELLLTKPVIDKVNLIKKYLAKNRYPDVLEEIIKKFITTKSNTEFLNQISENSLI